MEKCKGCSGKESWEYGCHGCQGGDCGCEKTVCKRIQGKISWDEMIKIIFLINE